MKNNELEEWLKLSDETKNNIFSETANSFGLPSAAVEKDWWVVQTLALVFNTAIAPYTVFKGGTSLSKAWNLIERFSEDIDLALDRSFLGFDKEMTKTQLKKLREKSFAYISESFFPEIKQRFDEAGLHDVVIKIGEVRDNEQDPLIIEIFYPTVTEKIDMESLNRTGRGLAGAAALVGAAVGGSHLAPKAYQAGKEIAGDIASRGGTDEFLARIENDEDRERVQSELQALRDEGTAARLSGKSDRVTRMRDEFRKTEQEMRQTYKIPDTIQIQENVNITTAIYLTEQTKSDSVRRSQPQQNLSFKERYKPKTSYQLDELRRYGL
jgi:hypothetical protein